MASTSHQKLSRRERQIMEILYRLGRATAAEVRAAMADAPGYSAVRATLRILEEKGAVSHSEQAGRYLFLPTTSPVSARREALRSLVKTFFAGSPTDAAAALLGSEAGKIRADELDRLAEAIEKARKEKS